MSTIEEKRRFNAGADTRVALVATGAGLARVGIAGDRLGEVGLLRRCVAHDLAVGHGTIALATDEGILIGATPNQLAEADPIEFESASAVGSNPDGMLAADSSGTVARYDPTESEWRPLGSVGPVTAIDGDLIGTTEGVYRVVGDELRHAGLDAVRDVSAVVPHAATADGLYRLANGWIDTLDGDIRVISIDAASAAGTLGRAHAATAERCYTHADGEWRSLELPIHQPVADVAYAAGTYVVTTDGTLLAAAGDGWRRHVLGLTDATAIEVLPGEASD